MSQCPPRVPNRVVRILPHGPLRYWRNVPEEYRAQIALWILRILVDVKMEPNDLKLDDWFRKTVGLKKNEDKKGGQWTALLEKKLQNMERGIAPPNREGQLYKNIDRMGEMISLTKTDKEILTFLVLLNTQACLKDCAELYEEVTPFTVKDILSRVLGVDHAEVVHALKADSALRSCGIIHLEPAAYNLVAMLRLLHGMESMFFDEAIDSQPIFQRCFAPLEPSALTPADFPHLQEAFSVLQKILCKSMEQRLKGINVLIYGETGTGKTEFAKVIGATLRAQLLAIRHEDEDSDLEEKHWRFRTYLLAQKVLSKQENSLILFDEVEDVFPDFGLNRFGNGTKSGSFKAWTNTVLESNPCPTLWLCNETWHIDPAFRRRFTYALHVPSPGRSVRRRILAKHLGSLPVSPEWIDKISVDQRLTPAMIQQACKVATLVEWADPFSLEGLMERTLQSSFEVMGLSPDLKVLQENDATHYSLDFLNSNQDIAEVVNRLRQNPKGRLCFYGPPGSGKTALAHYIAKEVDKPLIRKQASDILDCLVGGSEKNIAEMFREAKTEKALLLLDEADSFLRDRRGALWSWEVTQVNELLVQMENFDGLFICSTNLMDSLDQAALRRFDLKIAFGFLKPDQAWNLFLQSLNKMNVQIEDPQSVKVLRQQLQRLDNLTPGDFATVIRKARVLGKSYSSEQFIAEIESECRVKTGGRGPISGFRSVGRG